MTAISWCYGRKVRVYGTQHVTKIHKNLLWLVCVGFVLYGSVGYAVGKTDEKQLFDIDIPALDAADGLNRLAQQTGATLLFSYDLAKDQKANAVKGRYTLQHALDLLLRDTGLSGGLTESGIIKVSRKPSSKNEGGKPVSNEKSIFSGIIALMASVFAVSPTHAQNPQPSNENTFAIEEVIVTARKREENLQQTPISVSAYTGEEMELRGALDLVDVGAAAANVYISGSNSISGLSSSMVAFVRGIGQGDYIVISDPGVGIYLDGAYVSRMIGGLVDLVDLERAEVLRGPQGTLFGRNTIGGAINMISKKPDDSFHGRAGVTFGEDNHYEGNITVNAPLSDNIFGRVSAMYRKRDGYVDALQYDDLQLGEDDVFAVRAQLRFQPTENFTADLALDHTRERESPYPVTPARIGNLFGQSGGGNHANNRVATYNAYVLAAFGVDCQNSLTARETNPVCFGEVHRTDRFESNSVWTDNQGNKIRPENKMDVYGFNLNMDWALPFATLTSVTAWRYFDSEFNNDLDHTPALIFQNAHPNFSGDQFSQEIRVSGTAFDDRLDFVAGYYYSKENGNETVEVAIADFFYLPDGTTNPAGALFNINDRNIENTTHGVFAQMTWHITNRIHLTGGFRYTDSEKFFDLQILRGNQQADGTQVATEVTPMVSLGYDFTEDIFGYVSYSEGFRDGGFPARFIGGLPDPLAFFDPEFVEVVEVGMKSTLLDNRLRLNLAYFHTDYTDIQVAATSNQPGFSTNTGVENLAAATIQGVEAELLAVITDNFRLDLSLGYLDSEIDEVLGGSLNSPPFTITTDNRLPHSPEWSWNLGVSHLLPLDNGGEITTRIDWNYVDDQEFRIENPVEVRGESYSVVNASVTYRHPGNQWELTLGSRNLFDEDYAQSGSFSTTSLDALTSVARPRTVYGSIKYYWGQ